MSVRVLRIVSLLTACALLLTSLASCGKNEKKHFVMKTFSTFGAEKDMTAYSDIISEYTKTHKNVVINDTTTTQANSYKMALSIASTYRGPNSPDVVYFSALSDMSELSDFFMTVEDIRKDYPKFASHVSQAVLDSAAADDGSHYCIPVRGEWRGIVINAALFRKSALRIPETWDDLVRAAKHFKDGKISLFANSLDDSGALTEYLIRGLGGVDSVQSAMNGTPDETWSTVLDAIEQLDELSAFPPMPPESFDSLISPSDLKNTSAKQTASPVELYNDGMAAILLIDNSMCGSINTDIDSEYIALPEIGTVTQSESTTAANTYPTHALSGPVYPRITANTLPPTQTTSTSTTTGTPSPEPQTDVSPSDERPKNADNGLYVSFDEGFYITKKAYYDKDKREDILDFVECFLSEEHCVKLCGNYQAPSLSSISKQTENSLTGKSNIYHGVIKSVQAADSFVTTTQTQENSFFWSHCSMAISCMSKGILTKKDALRLIGDTQITVADIYADAS